MIFGKIFKKMIKSVLSGIILVYTLFSERILILVYYNYIGLKVTVGSIPLVGKQMRPVGYF